MHIEYSSEKTKLQCTSIKAAKKLFGGDMALTRSLLSRINALQQAETIKDIIVQPAFHFHSLENYGSRRLKGYFAVDVKTRRDPWRIILQPLDENKTPYAGFSIDAIAGSVRIIEISEVSKHYE